MTTGCPILNVAFSTTFRMGLCYCRSLKNEGVIGKARAFDVAASSKPQTEFVQVLVVDDAEEPSKNQKESLILRSSIFVEPE